MRSFLSKSILLCTEKLLGTWKTRPLMIRFNEDQLVRSVRIGFYKSPDCLCSMKIIYLIEKFLSHFCTSSPTRCWSFWKNKCLTSSGFRINTICIFQDIFALIFFIPLEHFLSTNDSWRDQQTTRTRPFFLSLWTVVLRARERGSPTRRRRWWRYVSSRAIHFLLSHIRMLRRARAGQRSSFFTHNVLPVRAQ